MTLRVLAFTPAPESGAAGRYRVFQYRESLRALGIELEPTPSLDEDAFGRLYRPEVTRKVWDLARRTRRLVARLRSCGRYDFALVHRESWPLAGGRPLHGVRPGGDPHPARRAVPAGKPQNKLAHVREAYSEASLLRKWDQVFESIHGG